MASKSVRANSVHANPTSRRQALAMLATLPALVPLTAAASPIDDRAAWDQRLREYQIRITLRDADLSFGERYLEEMRYKTVQHELVATHGSLEKVRASGDARKLASAYDRLADADSRRYVRFIAPADEAAVALAKTPAPDLEALWHKIEVIEAEDLVNFSDREVEYMEIVLADARRLGVEP